MYKFFLQSKEIVEKNIGFMLRRLERLFFGGLMKHEKYSFLFCVMVS